MAIGGIPNLASMVPVTITAGDSNYDSASLPPENLKTEEPSEVSRIITLDPWVSLWNCQFSNISTVDGPYFDVDHVFIGNHNAFSGGQYRVVAYDGVGFASPDYNGTMYRERLAPTGLSSGSNQSGVVGDIDNNPLTPDGSYIYPTTSTSAWSVIIDFATPTTLAAKTGADLQSFVLYVVAAIPSNSQSWTLPSIKVELYEGGVFRADLGTRYITKASYPTPTFIDGVPIGQYLIFPWDATLLSDQFGADVQLKITATPGTNSSIYVDEVAWDCERDGAQKYVYSSEWVDIPEPTDVGGLDPYETYEIAARNSSEIRPSRDILHFFGATYPSSLVFIAFRSAGYAESATSGVTTTTLSQTQPEWFPTYIQFGILCLGKSLELTDTSGIRPPGPTFSPITEERGGITEGGQTYAADSFRRRSLTADLQLTRENLNIIMDRIDWRKGHSGAFWVALESGLAAVDQQFMLAWVTLKSAGDAQMAPQAYQIGSDALFWRSMVFEEKL